MRKCPNCGKPTSYYTCSSCGINTVPLKFLFINHKI